MPRSTRAGARVGRPSRWQLCYACIPYSSLPLVGNAGSVDFLFEIEPLSHFVGLRLEGAIQDESAILNFRPLLD